MRLKVTKELIKTLLFYINNAPTRSTAYKNFARDKGCSVVAVRKLASRMGLTKKRSMHFSFTESEERDMAEVCKKYALRGEALTIPDVIELASCYKSRAEKDKFSRHFVSDFVKRHRSALCIKNGKDTSLARSSDIMDQHTEKFIKELNTLFERKVINKNTLCVFDETIIGDPARKILRVGARRKSGGSNINCFAAQGKAIGCFIPFCFANGTTPFRVFVHKGFSPSKPVGPNGEPEEYVDVVRTATTYDLLLSSKSGYVTIPLFMSIMQHFTKWWNETFPDLQCYLICDNLPVHVNDSVIEFAASKGVFIKPIMPGSSHWFQVQDQLPFGTLKNKMVKKKYKILRVSLLPPKAKRELLLGIFRLVYPQALVPHILLKSFADVGLWPWNPDLIRELCQAHCPPPSQLTSSPRKRKLERIMKQICVKQKAKRDKYMSLGRRFIAGSSENDEGYHLRPRKTKSPQLSEDVSRKYFSKKDSKSTQLQPPKKRSRRMQSNR